MRRVVLLLLLFVVELGGCYVGVRGCGCGPEHGGYHGHRRGGEGCGCACG